MCNGESRKGEGARSTAREGGTEEEEEEEEEEREDEKGPESGVGTKEGDDEEDAERRRIQVPLSPSLFLSLSLFPSLSILLHSPSFSYSPPSWSLPYPGPLPRFHDLSSGFQ